MKYLIGLLIFTIVISVLLYLAGAFGNASFDITTWNKDVRGAIAVTWVLLILSGAIGAVIIDENKN